ncbi:MAG: hypothetical protein WBL40_21660, partial [Terrimicrobiaceae bacterium]
MIKCRRDLNPHSFAVERINQIGFAVIFAVAEKLAVQLERLQQLPADGFLVTFLYLLLFHPFSFT